MKRTATIAAVAVALGIAGAGFSQNQPDQSTRVSGTVESLLTVQSEDQRDDHLVLRIQPKNAPRGEFRFVDLGSQRDLRNQNVQIDRGSEVTITGRQGQINQRSVLLAERVTVDGQQYTLDRTTRQAPYQQQARRENEQQQARQNEQRQLQQQQERARQQQEMGSPRAVAPGGGVIIQRYESDSRGSVELQDRPQSMRDRQRARTHSLQPQGKSPVVRGEILSLRDFSISGVDEQHRLIKVADARTDRTWVVDLGPTNALQKLDLEQGDRVMVQGDPVRIDGRPVIRATQIAEVIELRQTGQSSRSESGASARQRSRQNRDTTQRQQFRQIR